MIGWYVSGYALVALVSFIVTARFYWRHFDAASAVLMSILWPSWLIVMPYVWLADLWEWIRDKGRV